MSEREDKDRIWSEAALWFSRMRSPDAEAFRPEFEEWLSRGALPRLYYNRASEHWLHGRAAYAEERAQIRGGNNRQSEPRSFIRSKRSAIGAMIAASLVVAGSTILSMGGERGNGGPAGRRAAATHVQTGVVRLVTATGEQHSVRLGDGSTILLAGGTLLRVQFSGTLRRLDLDRGLARFEVAHESRPFVVFAGGGSVTAHGTIFDVGLSADRRVSVRLIKGSIDVQLPPSRLSAERPASRRLKAGEALSFEAIAGRLSTGPAAPASAPAEGAHDYQNVRLADLIGEANRQGTVPIRFADPAIGEHRISGRFRTDDTARLADRIAVLFDLSADRSNRAEIVLRPK